MHEKTIFFCGEGGELPKKWGLDSQEGAWQNRKVDVFEGGLRPQCTL